MKISLKRIMAAISFALGTAASSAAGFTSVENALFADTIQARDVILIDVRTPKEFAEGHIEGAININLNDPSFRRQISGLDKTKTLAIYCRSGRRSKTAATIAEQYGFKVVELKNGYINWNK